MVGLLADARDPRPDHGQRREAVGVGVLARHDGQRCGGVVEARRVAGRGDGTLDVEDTDLDGDGTDNEEDDNLDGDKFRNEVDPDMDGDGLVNEEDRAVLDAMESARSGVAVGCKRPEYDLMVSPPGPGFGDSIGAMTIAGGITVVKPADRAWSIAMFTSASSRSAPTPVR